VALDACPARLSQIVPQQMIHYDGPSVSKRLYRMADVTRHDRDHAWPGNLPNAIDGYLDLTLDHFPNLFLRMEVLVNR